MLSNITDVMFIIEAVFVIVIVYSAIRRETQTLVYTLQGAVVLFFVYCVFMLAFYEIGIR